MKKKRLKILGFVYWAAALVSVVICLFDVIIGGLFAPAVDIKGGIGVALLCVLLGLALTVFDAMLGRKLLQKDYKFALQKGLWLIALSVFTFIFDLIGGYIVIPALLGVILPAIGILLIR